MTTADIVEEFRASNARLDDLNAKRASWVAKLGQLQLEAEVSQGKAKRVAEAAVRSVQAELAQLGAAIKKANREAQVIELRFQAEKHRLKDAPPVVPPSEPLAEGLVELLGKYRAFASDRSRIASFRVVAGEVAADIESLLKRTVSS